MKLTANSILHDAQLIAMVAAQLLGNHIGNQKQDGTLTTVHDILETDVAVSLQLASFLIDQSHAHAADTAPAMPVPVTKPAVIVPAAVATTADSTSTQQ